MLVHQAAEQVHLMTGLRPPIAQMRAAGLAAMAGSAETAGAADRGSP
jgi:shikimate 5-dehydrogenase